MHTHLTTHSPEQTRAAAARLVADHPGIRLIALRGDLGAGKTCFVQGLAEGLGVEAPVTSPTYTLVHEYPGPRRLVHVDWYRLEDPEEAEALAIHEYVEAGDLVAVEWPERARGLIPGDAVWVDLREGLGPDDRVIEIRAGLVPRHHPVRP